MPWNEVDIAGLDLLGRVQDAINRHRGLQLAGTSWARPPHKGLRLQSNRHATVTHSATSTPLSDVGRFLRIRWGGELTYEGREVGIVPRMHRLSISLLAMVALTGCYSAPHVKLGQDLVITERTSEAQAGQVTVSITNPNDRSIELVEYRYSATASGHSTWTGRHAGGMVLAPGFDRQVQLPIVLPVDITPDVRVSISGNLRYLDTSVFAETLSEWGYRPTVGFGGTATISDSPHTTVSADR